MLPFHHSCPLAFADIASDFFVFAKSAAAVEGGSVAFIYLIEKEFPDFTETFIPGIAFSLTASAEQKQNCNYAHSFHDTAPFLL